MIVTEKILKRKYKEFNELYFNNELSKDMIFHLDKNLDALGRWNELELDGIVKPIIYINSKYIYTDDQISVLLLHEMIHAYLVPNGICTDDDEVHGEEFHKKEKEIEEKSGLSLTNKINNLDLNIIGKRFYLLILADNEENLYLNCFDKEKIFKWYVKYFKDNPNHDNKRIYKLFTSQKGIFGNFEICNEIGELNATQFSKEEFEKEIMPYIV